MDGPVLLGGAEVGGLVYLKGPGRFHVKETGPRVGVFVNGERVVHALLHDGDFLRAGEATYRFVLEPEGGPVPVARVVPAPAGEAAAHAAPAPADATPTVACARCGTPVLRTVARRKEGHWYCASCAHRPKPKRRGLPLPTLVGLGLGGAAAVVLLVALIAGRGGPSPAGPPTPVAPAAAPKTPPGPLTVADLVSQVEGAVASITDGDSGGTGFLVADGVLATNAHVIRESYLEDLRVQYPSRGGPPQKALGILHQENRRDLALLRVAPGGTPVRLSRDTTYRRGEEVILVGNPGVGDGIVLKNAVTQGLLGPRAVIDDVPFVQISASVNPGNSGGPVFDRKGNVLCIATLKAGGQEGIAFGVPATAVWDALDAVESGQPPASTVERLHLAEVVFLRLSRLGAAYLTGVYLQAQALEFGLATGEDPSAVLHAVRLRYRPELEEAKQAFATTSTAKLHRLLADERADPAIRGRLEALRKQVDALRPYAEQPSGRIDTYLTVYQMLRVQFASAVSRLSDDFGGGHRLEEELPPQK